MAIIRQTFQPDQATDAVIEAMRPLVNQLTAPNLEYAETEQPVDPGIERVSTSGTRRPLPYPVR
jgi:hypothetical protein